MYLIPVVVVVGVTGNIVSLCVFLTTYLRKRSWSIYLAALAISDTGFLCCVFVSWSNNIGIHIYHKNILCQTFVYLSYDWSFLSVWYVVAFTLERFLVIQYPLRRNELTTPRRARIVVVSLALIALLMYSYAIWTSGIQPSFNYDVFCVTLPQHYEVVTVLSNIDTFITFVIPFLLIMCLNAGIIFKLARHHAKHHGPQRTVTRASYLASERFVRSARSQGLVIMSHSTVRSSLMAQRARQHASLLNRLTYMLLVVSGVFLILNFPFHAIRFYIVIQQFVNPAFHPSYNFISWQTFFQYVYYLNFAVNIVLYSMCGKTFRHALRLLLNKSAHRIRHIQLPVIQFSCTREQSSSSELSPS